MSDFEKRYRLYQVIATLCVALFIVNMAFCLMCTDKYIYKTTYAKWIKSIEVKSSEAGMDETEGGIDYTQPSQFQAELIFQELSDEFLTFFSGKFELTGYELNADNIKSLNALKWRFRKSVIVVILSIAGFAYSNIRLSRRRELTPLLYGAVLAAFFTALRALFIVLARHGVKAGIRAMLLHKDYGYFSSGDILEKILPPDYAMFMALLYAGWVAVLIIAVLLVRKLIIFAGRPHKY
jgi:hypothetical protein